MDDDWTSFCDVGSSFAGVTLSQSEYLRVETAYLEAALAFLDEDQAPDLRVVGLEIRNDRLNATIDGSILARADLISVCRSVLREEFWCKLEAAERFVHFGRDYYMYVGVVNSCENAILRTTGLGLFVEEFHSPYLIGEEEGA